jgi:hypothetical protein
LVLAFLVRLTRRPGTQGGVDGATAPAPAPASAR